MNLLSQPVLGFLHTVWCDVEQHGDLLGTEVGLEVGTKPEVVGRELWMSGLEFLLKLYAGSL